MRITVAKAIWIIVGVIIAAFVLRGPLDKGNRNPEQNNLQLGSTAITGSLGV